MTTRQLAQKIKKVEIQKIGKTPVVVLPLKVWQDIESSLEVLEAEGGHFLAYRVAKARRERKFYSANQVKKALGV